MPVLHPSLPKPHLGCSRTLPTQQKGGCLSAAATVIRAARCVAAIGGREGTQPSCSGSHTALSSPGDRSQACSECPSRRDSFSLAPLAIVLYVFWLHQLYPLVESCLNTMVVQSQFNWTFSLDSLENSFRAYIHFCSGESSAGRASDQDKVGPDFQWVSILENSQELSP